MFGLLGAFGDGGVYAKGFFTFGSDDVGRRWNAPWNSVARCAQSRQSTWL